MTNTKFHNRLTSFNGIKLCMRCKHPLAKDLSCPRNGCAGHYVRVMNYDWQARSPEQVKRDDYAVRNGADDHCGLCGYMLCNCPSVIDVRCDFIMAPRVPKLQLTLDQKQTIHFYNSDAQMCLWCGVALQICKSITPSLMWAFYSEIWNDDPSRYAGTWRYVPATTGTNEVTAMFERVTGVPELDEADKHTPDVPLVKWDRAVADAVGNEACQLLADVGFDADIYTLVWRGVHLKATKCEAERAFFAHIKRWADSSNDITRWQGVWRYTGCSWLNGVMTSFEFERVK